MPYADLITPLEAQRAIYIDFEGFQNQPPSLFGWVWAIGKKASDDHLACMHDIHDSALWPLVGEVDLGSGEVDLGSGEVGTYEQRNYSVGSSINDLARRAEKQDRRIVSWSTHEKTKIEEIAESELSPSLFEMFEENYRDGKATARRWFQQLGLPTTTGTNTLVRYLEQAPYRLPDTYGLGKTTQRLKSVLNGIERRGSWSQLTDSQQKNWEGLLIHNFVDCHGLRHVIKTAANALS